MDRRRALSASVMNGGGGFTYDEYFGQIPPESKTFKFPLYITVPFTEENDISLSYDRDADDIGKQLYHYCLKNAVLVREDRFYEFWEVPDIPDIYINGRKVHTINFDATIGSGVPDGGIRTDVEGIYQTTLSEDGSYNIWILK
jgi:hypothetical protein